jgi:hypothetical protein
MLLTSPHNTVIKTHGDGQSTKNNAWQGLHLLQAPAAQAQDAKSALCFTHAKSKQSTNRLFRRHYWLCAVKNCYKHADGAIKYLACVILVQDMMPL